MVGRIYETGRFKAGIDYSVVELIFTGSIARSATRPYLI